MRVCDLLLLFPWLFGGGTGDCVLDRSPDNPHDRIAHSRVTTDTTSADSGLVTESNEDPSSNGGEDREEQGTGTISPQPPRDFLFELQRAYENDIEPFPTFPPDLDSMITEWEIEAGYSGVLSLDVVYDGGHLADRTIRIGDVTFIVYLPTDTSLLKTFGIFDRDQFLRSTVAPLLTNALEGVYNRSRLPFYVPIVYVPRILDQGRIVTDPMSTFFVPGPVIMSRMRVPLFEAEYGAEGMTHELLLTLLKHGEKGENLGHIVPFELTYLGLLSERPYSTVDSGGNWRPELSFYEMLVGLAGVDTKGHSALFDSHFNGSQDSTYAVNSILQEISDGISGWERPGAGKSIFHRAYESYQQNPARYDALALFSGTKYLPLVEQLVADMPEGTQCPGQLREKLDLMLEEYQARFITHDGRPSDELDNFIDYSYLRSYIDPESPTQFSGRQWAAVKAHYGNDTAAAAPACLSYLAGLLERAEGNVFIDTLAARMTAFYVRVRAAHGLRPSNQ
ncbi:hypothetical protein ACFL6M_05800 [Candidatus Eisenbacteria bacterium]|uniref:DUF1570 domain-containing protein n=1 Tax=Eiseniibacteriota bacterium TaxID=2212470 RepID=A0ABV6YL88_UNCEI